MPGKARLQEIVKESIKDVWSETGSLQHAADTPGQCTESYVAEHAAHAHTAIDKAADACRILVVEES